MKTRISILKNNRCLLLLFMLLSGKFVIAQTGANDTLQTEAVIYEGEVVPAKTLQNVYIYYKFNEAQLNARAKYNRLRNAVYVTYPYARRAGTIMNDINDKFLAMPKKSDRRSYIKTREKELKKEFTEPLTNLSVYQGKVLMKLINRETGNNCYEIIKEYRGGFTARLYQTVAFFFNSNLKQPYDPSKDDAVIEKLVMEVQRMYGYPEIKKTSLL